MHAFDRLRLLAVAALAAAGLALAAAPAAPAAGLDQLVPTLPKLPVSAPGAPRPPARCAAASAAPARVSLRTTARSTLCLLNAVRRRHGLRPLRLSTRLTKAAVRHSRDMVRRRYFAHGNFVGRIRSSGYLRSARSWSVGENIAWGAGSRAAALATVRAWMHSPGHRANILNRSYRHIGVGIALGAPTGMRPAATYTTDFGTRR